MTDHELTTLLRTYDPLLGGTSGGLTEAQADELAGLARIYDLDPDRPAPEVWREVRRLLAGQAAADAETPAPEPLTILVAEDDGDTAAGLIEALTEAGHRVVGPFQEAETAIVSAALHDLDLALLDINLAGEQSGVDLARKLRETWGVRSVFLSADIAQAARHADDIAGVVLKPYSTRQVLNAVAAAARDETQPRSAPAI